MANTQQKPPRKPKLRSSCDGCGGAKLKCDRGQPECGRCLSLGQECHYGVSRKMGKPPRKKIRAPETPSEPRTLTEHNGSYSKERNSSYSTASDDFSYDASSVVDSYPHNFSVSADGLDALHTDLLGPLLPDFAGLEFGDGLSSNLESMPISALGSPHFKRYSTPGAFTEASQNQFDEHKGIDSALFPPSSSKNHDCFREAYEIMGSLSFTGLNNAISASQSPAGPAGPGSTTAKTTNRVPLDDVLHRNREASEQLGLLLTCSCARSPHLALLYASIVSRILVWYRQAADCMQSSSSVGANVDVAPQNLSLTNTPPSLTGSSPSSGSESRSGSSAWFSKAPSTFNTGGGKNTPTLAESTGLSVEPAGMTIGTFNVDDVHVQTVLKIQLLSGEMRRAGRLIDQFTSHSHSAKGQNFVDEYGFGGINSLYQNLESWLRGEHSKVSDMMSAKLRGLNM